MRFRTDCPVHIVMLGCGGTGGHIAPHLYRLLHALFRPSKVILCDGDIVEKKNLVRQNFIASDLGKNKAEVLATRYSGAFGMETCFSDRFAESEQQLKNLLTPNQRNALVILIGAVDNNRSRQLCNSVFYQMHELITSTPATVFPAVRWSAVSAEAAAPSRNRLHDFIRIFSNQRTNSRPNGPARKRLFPHRRPLRRISWRQRSCCVCCTTFWPPGNSSPA